MNNHHLDVEHSRLNELKAQCAKLNALAGRIQSDVQRPLSTRLYLDDPLVLEARACKVPVPPLITRGTLLAAVLAEVNNTELAILSIEHRIHTIHHHQPPVPESYSARL